MLFNKKKMSVQELFDGEQKVKTKLIDEYGWPITTESVKQNLSLIIEKVDLDDDIEAMLTPDDRANGRIQINTKYADDETFDYLHEVIHYIEDVGVGNKVTRSYPRLHAGNREDPHERQIDYMAAVALVPGNELLRRIEYYRNHWHSIDEIRFMHDLQKEFKCSAACLRERLKEVHTLRRHRLLPL